MYGCDCRTITRKQLENNDINIVNDIEWADIIYEGGGVFLYKKLLFFIKEEL